jgi:Protein of unknown function (DUF1778)
MARRLTKSVPDPFTPIMSEEEWDEKGWARESEPLTASSQLGAVISIKLDPANALLVRRAARLLGVTWSEFVQRAAIEAAAEAVRQSEQ